MASTNLAEQPLERFRTPLRMPSRGWSRTVASASRTPGLSIGRNRAFMRGWQTTAPSPSRGLSLDRMRVLQGHGVGPLQDAARADPHAQRDDT
jgi:hypothetical protein